MADDIDVLLDEVEDKYLKKTPVTNRKKAELKKCNLSKRTKEDEDLDAAIDDIIEGTDVMDLPGLADTRKKVPTSQQITSNSLKKSQKRCFPVYLGGSAILVGVSSVMIERACDQLRCTSCDFKVVFYDNVQWDSSCDYIFFRNNVPDYQRLCRKLKRKKGCRAYACQCTWRSVTSLINLAEEEIKWVCGKHS